MKDKTLQAYSQEKYSYNILKDLRVTVNINENPYNMPMETLFLMAARKNKKRGFLFVSKLLGKHIPVNPYDSLLAGTVLGAQYMKVVYDLDVLNTKDMIEALRHQKNAKEVYDEIKKQSIDLEEPTIFIGFAETATALGHAVFDCFSNSTYIHTTREDILGLESPIHFEEEHSHATSHRCYPMDKDLFQSKGPIVLVDDEITTGKTGLNIIEAIHKVYPRKEYAVVSLLDWRTKEDRERYNELEQRLGIKIHTVSLISGSIEVEGKPIEDKDVSYEQKTTEYKMNPEINIYRLQEKNLFKTLLFSSQNTLGEINGSPYLKETGRFSITSKDQLAIDKACKKAGELLEKMRKGKNTLCLGTGEFMYIPMKISAYMGEGIKYHSTTRSPIHPYEKDGYGAKNGVSFKSCDDPSVMNYLYNIPYGHYDDLFVFFEREADEENLNEILQILKGLGIPYITIVICTDSNIKEPDPIGSYDERDVIFLLKDITSVMKERGTEDREEAIQNGIHYSEMLPKEYKPSPEYMDVFYSSLNESAKKLAVAVGVVSERIIKNRGKNIVLASLARAGTPIGILMKKYISYKYGIHISHYSISIIRGKGIDENAVKYILKKHPNTSIQFVDGWTGKGAITKVLQKACRQFQKKYGIHLDDDLAVLADPGYCVSTYGTREDFLIASACLNSTVSGLVSRTVHRKDLIGPNDFHGAKYYKELEAEDVSQFFIDTIVKEFSNVEEIIKKEMNQIENSTPTWAGIKDIEKIQEEFKIDDINLIKPGIGETTRVLLRRVPWKILVKKKESPNLKHILLLAKDRNVPIETYPHMTYECCGLIKPLKENNL